MADHFYLGIDGGGTTSRARLVDEAGRLLGEGVAGSSNLTLGTAVAAASIRAACDAAIAASNIPGLPYAEIHAGFGLAGANVPELAAALREISFGFATALLASDAEIACFGAHGGKDGAILILGTGSQGLALVQGKVKTIGGWGFLVGDDGSGAQLGRSAIRAALRAHEGWSQASDLSREIMAHFGDDPARMVIWAAQATPRDYGQFAPWVLRQHAQGDALAKVLIAKSLVHICAMLQGLAALGARNIALMGGLASSFERLLPPEIRLNLVAPEADAVHGALILARRGAVI